ncbi:MAG TPA: hypothetical protein VJ931_13365 [Actinomycetota bacterium]|nr:hypothetical protein [Actinomycetota bacterium]
MDNRAHPPGPGVASPTGGPGTGGSGCDWALAAQPGVHPELLVSSQEPPGRVTLTVDVADLDARVRWLRDLGRPDPHPGRSRYRG